VKGAQLALQPLCLVGASRLFRFAQLPLQLHDTLANLGRNIHQRPIPFARPLFEAGQGGMNFFLQCRCFIAATLLSQGADLGLHLLNVPTELLRRRAIWACIAFAAFSVTVARTITLAFAAWTVAVSRPFALAAFAVPVTTFFRLFFFAIGQCDQRVFIGAPGQCRQWAAAPGDPANAAGRQEGQRTAGP
jgi:hypothetical protein